MRSLACLIVTLVAPGLALGAGEDAKAKSPAADKKIEKPAGKAKWLEKVEKGGDLFATFETSLGNITVRLFPKDAPKTVQNFVGLATGEKEWTDPRTHQKSTKPLYDGTIFHRVIPNFMIQGGDPLGQGIGGPGYQFEDEFKSGRAFDKPCILAMANAGPGTNGSQFFITEQPTPHLTNHHTIFGEVIRGCERVGKIARVEAVQTRPKTDVVLKRVSLSEKPPK
jgi:peptidyl-prolyl cis-trans isomerase A (cyclophilin A)